LTPKNPHKVLGIAPGSTEGQIKTAYRKLALKFHPDLNNSSEAQAKFQEINDAYKYLLKQGDDDTVAREVYRRERERMQRQARARQDKKRRQDEYFNRPEWHDPILLIRYIIHGFGILFAAAAILGPVLFAIFKDPASLAGTFFFLVAGVFVSVYIYQHRKGWFRLGKFKTTWKDIAGFLKMEPERRTTDRCCYSSNTLAGGKSYTIELLNTVVVKVHSYGALNHQAKYKNRMKRVVVPRSVRAHLFHRITSLIKAISIFGCMLFFPVESLLWRFMASILVGGILSSSVLIAARVKSKVGYLFTPGLILKVAIWFFSLAMISEFGPGFNIQTSGYVYLLIAGLLFLLDMAIDLVLGFFPFYRLLFRPVIRQGKVLESLYKEGYQNYQELPVYSMIYPLIKWLF
jgi:curved DNA-binding protein CbpA